MEKERARLEHEPVPGYRSALYILVGIGVIYLTYIFASALC